jgi:ribonuclease HII
VRFWNRCDQTFVKYWPEQDLMSRRILIGTDEAGYGPNLGPLTVTATAWEIPAELDPASLWEEFGTVLTNAPQKGDSRLFVADSKAVFSAGDGLEDLEVPVLAFLQTLGYSTDTIDCIGESLAGGTFAQMYREEIWNPSPGLTLPRDASDDHIAEWKDALATEMNRTGIRLLGVRSRIMFPKEFNHLVLMSDSKGSVLSMATLQLVRELSDQFSGDHPTQVICDKHGGRNRYDELIACQFDDQFVFRIEESRERSRYRMGLMDFCFRTKAEELLPVALASMVSKYLREVFMLQFNAFWTERIPGLKPTQGYPVDAKRFRNAIAETAISLCVSDTVLWRNR